MLNEGQVGERILLLNGRPQQAAFKWVARDPDLDLLIVSGGVCECEAVNDSIITQYRCATAGGAEGLSTGSRREPMMFDHTTTTTIKRFIFILKSYKNGITHNVLPSVYHSPYGHMMMMMMMLSLSGSRRSETHKFLYRKM